jgi:hypothetical protein
VTDVDYFIRVQGTSGEYELVYSFVASDFCPDLGFVGSPCSHGTPLTYYDLITSDCECVGDPIPAGSLCQNAIPIVENPFIIDYYNPTFEDFVPFFHSINDIPPFLDSLGSGPFTQSCYAAKDVVFSFTPDEDKFVDITASISNSNVEPNITILTGCPFNTAHVAEGCGTPNFFVKKIENFHALADTTYYILIDGQPQLTGFNFNVDALIEVVQKTFCSELEAFQFDPCDDGNLNTSNDLINENCECEGTAIPGEFCENALELIPTPGLTVSPLEYNENGATFSGMDQCSGVGGSRDTWFYFDAVTTNMAVGAKGKMAAYDMVLEVYDSCGGQPLVCKDNNGGGGKELHLLTDCEIGQRFYVRAYDGNGFSPFNKFFFIAVSSLPVTSLEENDCGSMVELSSTIFAEIPNYQYAITNWVFEFTELEAPFNTYEYASPNGNDPSIILNAVPDLEAGRSYEVRVKGGIRNGQIFGDYGEPCTITISDPAGFSVNGSNESAENIDFNVFPNPNDGSEVYLAFSGLTDKNQTVKIRFFDLTGRMVLNESIQISGSQSQINLSINELSSGVYNLGVELDGKNMSKKLFVK